jgi:hypothetical protein
MVSAFAERERISYFEALRRADEAPGVASRSVGAIRTFIQMIDDLRALVDVGEPADVVLQAAGAQRLPVGAGGVVGPAGRDPGREPRGAGRGGARVRG